MNKHDELVSRIVAYLLREDPLSTFRTITEIIPHFTLNKGKKRYEIDILVKATMGDTQLCEIIEVQRNYSKNGTNIFEKKQRLVKLLEGM